MEILKLSYKQFGKYLFFFIVAVFLASSVFICHTSANEVVNLTDSCRDEDESLFSQSDSKFVFLNFNSIISEKSSNLDQEINTTLIFLEDLDGSQAAQLLTIAKIE